MNGHQEQDEVDGGGIGLIFQRRRHKSDNVDSPVTKRIRNGSGPPKNSPGSKRNSTGERNIMLPVFINYVILLKLYSFPAL